MRQPDQPGHLYGRTDAQDHPVTGEALMLRTNSGMQSLYIYDGTGNPATLITSTPTIAFAYDYDPYGVPTLTTDSGGLGTSQNPYTFKAGIQDRVTGWVKYGQRWYNPTLGRWTQQDTLDAPLNPANANRYAFAANDPVNNSDPRGLLTLGSAVGFGIGLAFSAAVTGLFCAATLGGCGFVALAVVGAVSGGVGGLTGGAVGAAIDGGNVNQGALTGGAFGAYTGALGPPGVILDAISAAFTF